MIEAWHFLQQDRCLRFPPHTLVEPGQKLVEDKPLAMCIVGLHASERAIDAISYSPGSIVCRVMLSGEVIKGKDKLCASERTCLWMADATRVLHEFACWCAEAALDMAEDNGIRVDIRSRQSIAAKRDWIDGKISSAALATLNVASYEAQWEAHWTSPAAFAAAVAAFWSSDLKARLAARKAARGAALTASRIQIGETELFSDLGRYNAKLEEMLYELRDWEKANA